MLSLLNFKLAAFKYLTCFCPFLYASRGKLIPVATSLTLLINLQIGGLDERISNRFFCKVNQYGRQPLYCLNSQELSENVLDFIPDVISVIFSNQTNLSNKLNKILSKNMYARFKYVKNI